jgi:preprotein translocase subunit SecG
MQQLLLLVHIVISIVLIVLVLLQQGKGADAGASFGSGASQTVFGSQGTGSFMLRLTSTIAALFFITSLALGYLSGRPQQQQNLMNLQQPVNTDTAKS